MYIPITPNYNHEEADTRMNVHILHVLKEGLKKIQLCTIDNDVMYWSFLLVYFLN